MGEDKIGKDYGDSMTGPTAFVVLDVPKSVERYPHHEFNNDFLAVKPDDSYKNWGRNIL